MGVTVDVKEDSQRGQLLSEALQHLQVSIDLLDAVSAPAHIGAHIDLAIHQLQDVIESDVAGARLAQIDRNAEPH